MDPRIAAMMAQMQAGGGAAAADGPKLDTAETVHISSLALLKMLKHGARAAPPPLPSLTRGRRRVPQGARASRWRSWV